jgi:hypothetical protein
MIKGNNAAATSIRPAHTFADIATKTVAPDFYCQCSRVAGYLSAALLLKQ